MKEYLLIFRNANNMMRQSQEAMAAIMDRWTNWMGQLAQDGKLISGQPLTPEGRLMETKTQITDAPFAEGKEVVNGFMLIKASGYDEAIALSTGCPVFDDAGTVEVREIAVMDM